MLRPIIFIDVDSARVKPSIFFISSPSFPMLLNMGLLAMAAAEPANDAYFDGVDVRGRELERGRRADLHVHRRAHRHVVVLAGVPGHLAACRPW